MTKKKKNVTLVFLITIIITFVLVGGTAFAAYSVLSNDYEKKASSVSSEELPVEITAKENQTTLFILDSGSRKNDKVFVLTRFLAPEKKIIFVPISGDMLSQINTEQKTIYEFYDTGGVIKASTAIENALDIKIQKYMKFNKEAFQSLGDIFGGVNVKIPYDLINENKETGESVVIRKGVQFLDGIRLRQLFTFPQFKDGEKYREEMIGTVITDLINKSLNERLYNTLDTSFNTIINQVETNITAYDYKFRKDAMLNMIVPGEKPAEYVTCTGKYNDKNQFILDSTFKTEIKKQFELKDVDE